MEQVKKFAQIRPTTTHLALAVLGVVLCASVSLILPETAYASPFNIVEDINNFIAEIVRNIATSLLSTAMGVMSSISASSILEAPFETMLGAGGATGSIYDMANSLCQYAVKPVAGSILALVMLLELVKISQRIDGNSAMPALKEILFLFVFCAFFIFLINNSQDICIMIYNLVSQISAYLTSPTAASGVAFTIESDITDIGLLMVIVIDGLFVMLVAFIAYILALLMAYARAIQLYVMMAFAPIPFALLGFNETRSMGVGFIKNYAALCLAGTIMIFLLICFPLLINGVTTQMQAAGGNLLGAAATGDPATLVRFITSPLQLIACALLLCFGLIKSGSWARDILGG